MSNSWIRFLKPACAVTLYGRSRRPNRPRKARQAAISLRAFLQTKIDSSPALRAT